MTKTNYHITVSIAGMTCQHCVKAIIKGLQCLSGADSVKVDFDQEVGSLNLLNTDLSINEIKTLVSGTIEDLGYDSGTPIVTNLDSITEIKNNKIIKASFKVEGMTCSSCVHGITSVLSDFPLVIKESIQVSLETQMVIFHIKKSSLTEQEKNEFINLVDDMGYSVLQSDFFILTINDNNNNEVIDQQPLPNLEEEKEKIMDDHLQTASIPIIGMTCSHCVNTITTVLQSLPGVLQQTVDVNLDKGLATFTFEKNNSIITSQLLIDTIEELGYDVPHTPRIINGSKKNDLVQLTTSLTTATTKIDTINDKLDTDISKSTSSSWTKVVMSISGMNQESCVDNLTSAFYTLKDVQPDSVRIYLLTDMAMFICKNPNKELIQDLVESRGYKIDNIQMIYNLKEPAAAIAAANSDDEIKNNDLARIRSLSVISLGAISVVSNNDLTLKKVSFNISGMTCSSCVNSVEKGLAKLKSVDPTSVKVNLLTGSATLNVRGDVLNEKSFIESIDQMGYTASNVSMTILEKKSNVSSSGIDIYQVGFIVSGMFCESCVEKVRSVISKMPGVKKSSIFIDLDSGYVKFTMDKNTLTRQKIYKEIQQLGFSADSIEIKKEIYNDEKPTTDDDSKSKSKSTITTTRLTVTGMTCSSCVANIERVMLKQDGIKSCQVNLLAKSAVIVHDPNVIGARALADMIEQIGYKAELASADSTELADQRATMRETMQNEIKILRDRFLWSLLFAIPVFLISMIFLMAVPSSYSVRQAFQTEITSGLTAGDLILFVLATPVQFWLGLPFYKKTWKSLYYTHTANMETLVALGTTVAYCASLGSVIATIVRAHQPKEINPMSAHGSMDGMNSGEPIHMNYFETSVLLITFIHLGKWLEALAKGKTAETITKLMDLQPEKAILVQVKKDGENEILLEHEIDSREIQGIFFFKKTHTYIYIIMKIIICFLFFLF